MGKKITLEFYRFKISDSRKARYCLSCYDGSVYIDFNKKSGCIFLERISFDCFGCYRINGIDNLLTKKESKVFKKEIRRKEINNEIIEPLVIKLIEMNQNRIDSDVFDEYDLLKPICEC